MSRATHPAPDPSSSTASTASAPLTDEDIRTVKVDRRSFLSKALAAGSIAVGAALTAACPGGGGGETDADGTDVDSTDTADADATDTESTDTDSSDADGTDADSTGSDAAPE